MNTVFLILKLLSYLPELETLLTAFHKTAQTVIENKKAAQSKAPPRPDNKRVTANWAVEPTDMQKPPLQDWQKPTPEFKPLSAQDEQTLEHIADKGES